MLTAMSANDKITSHTLSTPSIYPLFNCFTPLSIYEIVVSMYSLSILFYLYILYNTIVLYPKYSSVYMFYLEEWHICNRQLSLRTNHCFILRITVLSLKNCCCIHTLSCCSISIFDIIFYTYSIVLSTYSI